MPFSQKSTSKNSELSWRFLFHFFAHLSSCHKLNDIAPKGWFFYWYGIRLRGIERIKCGANERRARRLDGAQP